MIMIMIVIVIMISIVIIIIRIIIINAISMIVILIMFTKMLVTQDDPETLADCLWALSHLSDGKEEKVNAVINSGAPSRVIELLNHRINQVQCPALRVIGNIAVGHAEQT